MNLWPILAAALAGLAIGVLFHLASRGSQRSPALLVVAFVAEVWLAAILAGALILAPPGAGAWVMAIGSAVVIWIGFVMPVIVVTHLHRGLGAPAAIVDSLHWLMVMATQAVVLRLIGLTPPPV